ncbi:Hypothetical predicted protein [Mytilus galloprovincialis]|uniref:Uncharacterized protein n=1 Tax=Mytilus galloprovincialis TaxID=29158 RepID=A0A8B6CXZ3_MYTGA|nr:Hypothetical predicted protein [Mytilus galloprovincialis]
MTDGAQNQSQNISHIENQVKELDDESKSLSKPNPQLRSFIPNKFIRDFVLFYGMHVLNFEELYSFEDRNYQILVYPVINNNYIQEFSKTGYVLKVLNIKDSNTPGFIESQHSILEHLRIICRKIGENKILITKLGQKKCSALG